MNNLWVLAIFLAMSFGSWLLNQLREQAKLKKARDEARRRYEEQLRTGRTEPSRSVAPAPVAAPSAEEAAQRRQAQLRELRKQQESSGRTVVIARPSPQAPARPAPSPIVLGPGGVVIARGPQQTGRVRPSPAERRETPDAAVAAAQQAEAARLALEQRRARERAEREAAALAAERATAIAKQAAASRSVRSVLVPGDSKTPRGDQLRRLIALKEILDPPMALRREQPL